MCNRPNLLIVDNSYNKSIHSFVETFRPIHSLIAIFALISTFLLMIFYQYHHFIVPSPPPIEKFWWYHLFMSSSHTFVHNLFAFLAHSSGSSYTKYGNENDECSTRTSARRDIGDQYSIKLNTLFITIKLESILIVCIPLTLRIFYIFFFLLYWAFTFYIPWERKANENHLEYEMLFVAMLYFSWAERKNYYGNTFSIA